MRTARVIPTTSFAIQMMDSGHKEGFRDMVISRVVAKYLNSLERHNRGLQPLYRTRDEREAAWSVAGGRPDKSDWFRKSGASAILTVPAPVGGRLAEKVKEATAPNPTGCSTLVREQPDPSIKQQLVRPTTVRAAGLFLPEPSEISRSRKIS